MSNRSHIHARSGRRACLACSAEWGTPEPCPGRVSRAVEHRLDREAPDELFRAALMKTNEAAGRPDDWG